MDLSCKKCGLTLGEMETGRIRKGTSMLCQKCWSKAEIAMEIAEMASKQSGDLLGGQASGKSIFDNLMDTFGLGGKPSCKKQY